MRPIKIFKIGSRAFFENLKGFISNDYDELCIMDRFPFKDTNSLRANLQGKDVIFYKNLSKEEYINDAIKSPIKIGKFLVPDFARYINLTIDDLKLLKESLDKLKDKHKYEKIIFDAYIENNDFILTEQQLNKAFEVYKKYKIK